MYHIQLDVGDEFYSQMAYRVRKSPGEVVMLLQRTDGGIWLMTKDFYPADIYRLPTGKMTRNESPEIAILRETLEETGVSSTAAELFETIACTFSYGPISLAYYSYIFLIPDFNAEPSPIDVSEGITDFKEVQPCELRSVTDQLRSIQGEWSDWGRWRAIAHELLFNRLSLPDSATD